MSCSNLNDVNVKNRNGVIDMIRGIAIIMVFFVHYGQTFDNPIITRFGQMGCQLFIMLSGYTCSMSLDKDKGLSNFYKKRYESISFGYYTMLVVIVSLNLWCKKMYTQPFIGEGHTGIGAVGCNFLLIHGLLPFCNNNVFPGGWFIGTIVLLYLIHPSVVWLMNRAKRKWAFSLIVIMFMMFVTVIVNYYFHGNFKVMNNDFSYFFFSNQMGCYLIGIYLYQSEKSAQTHKSIVVCGGLVLGLSIAIYLFYCNRKFSFIILPTLIGMVGYLLYIILRKEQSGGSVYKGLCFIGKHSYIIYLVHTIVAWKCAQLARELLINWGILNNGLQFVILLAPSIVFTMILAYILSQIIQVEKIIVRAWIR